MRLIDSFTISREQLAAKASAAAPSFLKVRATSPTKRLGLRPRIRQKPLGSRLTSQPSFARNAAIGPLNVSNTVVKNTGLLRGLVIFSSCSHRGIVNIVQQAKAASGVDKVHAIVGGFHLAPFKEDYVREVVAALKQTGPDYIIPMHCGGEPFYEILKAEMPEKLLRSYTGTQFTFET
jgi:hypothetical protein